MGPVRARRVRWYPAGVRVGLLVSGTGTIAEQMLAEGLPVVVVVADRPCRGLDLASERAVAAELVDRRQFGGFGPGFDRDAYSQALVDTLTDHGTDLVVMAGFGTVVGAVVHQTFPHRVLNTHPSLLPAFPGWHAVEDALAAGASVAGCTVHLAELAVDRGPVLAQQEVAVEPGDTADTLHERIKTVERWLYPATVRRVLRALGAGQDPSTLAPLVGTIADPLAEEHLAMPDRTEATGMEATGKAAGRRPVTAPALTARSQSTTRPQPTTRTQEVM